MKTKVVIILIFAVLLMLYSANNNKSVNELLELLEMDIIFNQLQEATISNVKQSMPNIKDEDLELCRKTVNQEEFFEILSQIYSKYFNEKEIKELVKFYSTPTGQKASKAFPYIQQEINSQLQEYNEISVGHIMDILTEKGYFNK